MVRDSLLFPYLVFLLFFANDLLCASAHVFVDINTHVK